MKSWMYEPIDNSMMMAKVAQMSMHCAYSVHMWVGVSWCVGAMGSKGWGKGYSCVQQLDAAGHCHGQGCKGAVLLLLLSTANTR